MDFNSNTMCIVLKKIQKMYAIVPDDDNFTEMVKSLDTPCIFKLKFPFICAGCYQPLRDKYEWDRIGVDPLCSNVCHDILLTRGHLYTKLSDDLTFDRCVRQCYLHYFKFHHGAHEEFNSITMNFPKHGMDADTRNVLDWFSTQIK